MSDKHIIACSKSLIQRIACWIDSRIKQRQALQFQGPTLKSCCSFYQPKANHTFPPSNRRVCAAECSIAIHNTGRRPRIMRDIRLRVSAGSEIRLVNLFDNLQNEWITNYNIPAHRIYILTWTAFLDGLDLPPVFPSLFPLGPLQGDVGFQISYLDENGRSHQIPVTLPERPIFPLKAVAAN